MSFYQSSWLGTFADFLVRLADIRPHRKALTHLSSSAQLTVRKIQAIIRRSFHESSIRLNKTVILFLLRDISNIEQTKEKIKNENIKLII